jgi:hypothetical protein
VITNCLIFSDVNWSILQLDVNKWLKKLTEAGCPWLLPVILATQEAEIRRIAVRSQPGQIVRETLSWKKPFTEKGWQSGSRCRPHTHTKEINWKAASLEHLMMVYKRLCPGYFVRVWVTLPHLITQGTFFEILLHPPNHQIASYFCLLSRDFTILVLSLWEEGLHSQWIFEERSGTPLWRNVFVWMLG